MSLEKLEKIPLEKDLEKARENEDPAQEEPGTGEPFSVETTGRRRPG